MGTDSVKSVPVVGQWMLEVMRGGPDVTINTLYRFFALHVVILPLITFGIIGVHLALHSDSGHGEAHGRTRRPTAPGLKFFPDFMLRDGLLWLCCLIVLAALVYSLPYGPGVPGIEWELGKKANPLAPAYPGIKPEWYFLWIYQLLKEFPPHLFGMEGPQAALIVVTVLMGTWALVPFLDRRARAGEDVADVHRPGDGGAHLHVVPDAQGVGHRRAATGAKGCLTRRPPRACAR